MPPSKILNQNEYKSVGFDLCQIILSCTFYLINFGEIFPEGLEGLSYTSRISKRVPNYAANQMTTASNFLHLLALKDSKLTPPTRISGHNWIYTIRFDLCQTIL